MEKILECQQITRTFSDQNQVLKGIDLTINRGDYISIMGPSGCGKTTLLFILSSIDNPSTGRVFIEGQDLADLTEDQKADLRRDKIGIVFQHPIMLKNLNIMDNIILPTNQKSTSDQQMITYVNELMKLTEIDSVSQNKINQVSGGQLQRAGICRALINHPQILFGDEPTGALNSATSRAVMDIFDKINQLGTTIILVTHDLNVAAQTKRVLLMVDGMIVDDIELDKDEEKNRLHIQNAMDRHHI